MLMLKTHCKLNGISDPEEKRKIIGNDLFVFLKMK